jgi:hypothetical protein
MADIRIDQITPLIIATNDPAPISSATFVLSNNLLSLILDTSNNSPVWMMYPLGLGSLILHITIGSQSYNLPINIVPAPVVTPNTTASTGTPIPKT